MEMWQQRLDRLHSINRQLDSPIAKDILRNLDEAQSTYAQSFHHVRRDIAKVSLRTIEKKSLMMMQSDIESLF